jgi:hypothetical protein
MADMWSGLGREISQNVESEWLYRVGAEVRGPVPQQVVAQKLVRGEISLETQVSKEGSGTFHPIARVAVFAPHITEAKKQADKRAATKMRRNVVLLLLPALLALGGGGYFVYSGFKVRKHEAEVRRAALEKELQEKRAKEAALPQMGLVALVSLGTEDDVKIRSSSAPRKSGGKPKEEEEEADEMVMQCKLSQADIFGTLKKALAKINVCVQDEKSRDTQGLLPPTLELSFVVTTSGKVAEFEIADRHYRTGPLKNCLTKVMNGTPFPSSNGANCPVAIPIKIGG